MADAQVPSIDTSRPPTGELAARRLVEALVGTDDRVERHFLEVKSDVDLTRTLGAAKIAKFILGAANRSVELAGRAFGGYAVMVIGVGRGTALGVPPVEVGEIDERVRPFLSAAGPKWDVVRVPVAPDRDVLLIVVDPPVAGQDPFLCWRDFSPSERSEQKHALRNGGLYVRAEGATRPATAEEIAALIQRGRTAHRDVDLEVTLVGTAVRPAIDSGLLGTYVTAKVAELLAQLPEEVLPAEPVAHSIAEMTAIAQVRRTLGNTSFLDALAEPMIPEDRTREAYIESIHEWATAANDTAPELLDQLIARSVPPVVLRVVNRGETFFEDVELTIHLDGDVDGRKPSDRRVLPDVWPPPPPRPWGPRSRPSPWASMPALSAYVPSLPSSYAPPAFSWNNGGSINGTWYLGDLRPRDRLEAFADEAFVAIVRDPGLDAVHGAWSLTSRGHHVVYEGDLDLAVSEPPDIDEDIRAHLARLRD